MALQLPALLLILDLNVFCYQDLGNGAPRLSKYGKNLFLGTEFPVSSQTAHCDAGISLFALRYSVRSTREHGDVEVPTGLIGEKKGERRRTKLLWTQGMWKCVAL